MQREIPVYDKEYDQVVAGGGPAGTAAAMCAARLGIQVLLVEAMGCLGGMGTSGLVAAFDPTAKNTMKKKPTQQDVASLASVSRSTVLIVLNNQTRQFPISDRYVEEICRLEPPLLEERTPGHFVRCYMNIR
jgi:heterodisulfide reductase subunit A-like polyferredoxin